MVDKHRIKCETVPTMKRINTRVLEKWIENNGKHEAVALLIQRTGLSPSTMDKIVRGVYPSEPTFLVQKAFAETTHIEVSVLFPDEQAS